MKRYLSFGGGINSTALLILLKGKKIEFETVFVDHGGDYPETYEYVEMLKNKGYAITIVKGERNGLNLYDYSLNTAITPSRQLRWCTADFKIKPLYKYFERPCIVYIGIDASESHRAKPSRDENIQNEFPLIDEGIDRAGCEKIIFDVGLPLPRKSGCYFCPFASVKELRKLRTERPELWCKTKKLEDTAINRRLAQGKEPFYLKDRPLDEIVNEGQDDLFGWRKPCQCGL